MSNFNWQTDDDVNWDDLEPAPVTAVPRRHPWVTYLLIVAGVITAVVLIYRQINQRIEVATANATSDILASHNLVQQASTDQDVELFNTLLSGVDDAWVEAQSELVQQNGLFDRTAFDLTRQPQATAVTLTDVENGHVNVEISPELNAAELTFPQAYIVAVGNGVTQTVQLQQTAVYRLGTQRWLYAPPNEEFWGEFETTNGTMLNLTYPERDSEIAQRLALDLDDKLVQMCRTVADLDCPEGFRVRLRFEHDPQSLVDVTRPTNTLRNETQLSLPTPTLVGLPVNDAGYQALYRGYAIHLAGAAITRLTDYRCCTHMAYFQALLDYQLGELGMRPLTLDRVDYERVVREGIAIEDMDSSWRSGDGLRGEDGWLAVTAVDFIRQNLPHASIANLQRRISSSRGLVDWLSVITNELAADPEMSAFFLSRRWQSYAFEQYQTRLEPPPLSLPAQDIYLLCAADLEEPFTELHQYNLAAAQWTQWPLELPALSLNPLPDDGAFLLQNYSDTDLQTSFWQNGRNQLLLENQTITFGQFDPAGQYLQVYRLNDLAINRVDWAACLAGDCAIEPLSGYPVWSPQGTDFILLPAEALGYEPFVVNGRAILFDSAVGLSEWSLHRGNGQPPTGDLAAMTYLGAGYAPFWLDETTFGYIRRIPLSSDSRRHELVVMTPLDELPQPVFSEEELQSALPNNRPTVTVSLLYAVPHPQQPEQLFVVASGDDRLIYVFSYDLRTDDVQFLLETAMDNAHSLGFSPDGRFLLVTGSRNGQRLFADMRSDLHLYDLATHQIQTFAGPSIGFAPSTTYDWSADGQWLVTTQENQMVILAAPAYGYQQFIPHDLGNCINAAWLN